LAKIRIKTLVKFLHLYILCRERKRLLTYREIMEELECCASNSYNYLNALKKLLSSMIA
jgi:hypothetical protein